MSIWDKHETYKVEGYNGFVWLRFREFNIAFLKVKFCFTSITYYNFFIINAHFKLKILFFKQIIQTQLKKDKKIMHFVYIVTYLNRFYLHQPSLLVTFKLTCAQHLIGPNII